MRLQVKGRDRGQRVDSDLRRAQAGQVGRAAAPTQVELELAVERNASIKANHVAEATIWRRDDAPGREDRAT